MSSSPFIFTAALEFVLHADKFEIALKVEIGKDVKERGSRMWYEWKLKLWCLAVCVSSKQGKHFNSNTKESWRFNDRETHLVTECYLKL